MDSRNPVHIRIYSKCCNMNDTNKLVSIIQEEIKLIEAQVNPHANFRIDGRLNKMVLNKFLTISEAQTTAQNLATVVDTDFDPDKSFGIKLSRFHVNLNANQVRGTLEISGDGGKSYYRIYQEDDNDIVKDSTGNEFWGIVRGNKLVTIFLRKDYQRRSAHLSRNDDGGLGVTDVIDDINTYIKNGHKTDADLKKEFEIEQQREREAENLKKAEKEIRIDGVKWFIDDQNNRVSKKNNPNVFVSFDDVLDYEGWDDQTKNDILNRI